MDNQPVVFISHAGGGKNCLSEFMSFIGRNSIIFLLFHQQFIQPLLKFVIEKYIISFDFAGGVLVRVAFELLTCSIITIFINKKLKFTI